MSLTPNPSNLQSPCVLNCCLNEEDICLGCGRSLVEITQWSSASIEDKYKILQCAALRKRSIRLPFVEK